MIPILLTLPSIPPTYGLQLHRVVREAEAGLLAKARANLGDASGYVKSSVHALEEVRAA